MGVTVKRRKKFVTFFLGETMIFRKINLFFILLWLAVATESRLAKRNDDVEPDGVDEEDIDVEAPMKSADVPQGQEADAPAAQADDEDIDVEAPMKSADVRQGQGLSFASDDDDDDYFWDHYDYNNLWADASGEKSKNRAKSVARAADDDRQEKKIKQETFDNGGSNKDLLAETSLLKDKE